MRGGRPFGGARPRNLSIIYTPDDMETDSEQSERTPINELFDEDTWGFGGNISDELELDFLIYLNDFDEPSKQSVNETQIKEKVQEKKRSNSRK